MVGEGRNNLTYADYLRQGNSVNPAYVMPPEAQPPVSTEIFDAPTTSRSMSRTTTDYIRMAEKRELSLNKGIRNEVIRQIRKDSFMAGKKPSK